MNRSSFFSQSRSQVFAHRGGCALGPENTIVAFDLGLAAGADGLELDVHLSSDGIPVVHHDDTLDRCTNARGPLAARTADELARVDAGHHFTRGGQHPFRGQSVGVPALAAVLRRYRDIPIIVEMKVDSREMGDAVARELRRADAVERVCAAGFGSRSAAAVRAALPGIATSACHSEARLDVYRSLAGLPVRAGAYGGYQVPERAGLVRIVTPYFIRNVHAAGRKLHVWTVDDEADMRRLLDWGVDGLISNRPDVAVRVRNTVFP